MGKSVASSLSVLELEEKQRRTLSTGEYNGRNGRLPQADVSVGTDSSGLLLGASASAGVKRAGRSFDVSSLSQHTAIRSPIHHSPHNLSESRESCGFSGKRRGSAATEATATPSPEVGLLLRS